MALKRHLQALVQAVARRLVLDLGARPGGLRALAQQRRLQAGHVVRRSALCRPVHCNKKTAKSGN